MISKKVIKNLFLIFLGLILLYSLGLIAVYLIPDSLISEKWQSSVEIIANESKRWMVIPGNEATKLDTFTDNLIFQRLTNDKYSNALISSFWIDGYYRYWMGIHVLLRPLLLFIDYSGIRYFNIFLLMGLFGFSFSLIKKYVGNWMAIIYVISLGMIHAWIFPLSLQYSSAFIVMLFSILVIFYLYSKDSLSSKKIYLFFMIGSLTNFFDLLTVPLLTYGIPFVILFSLENKEKVSNTLENYYLLIITGITWLLGYSLTWVTKWILGSIILKENIIHFAIQQILFRTSGNEEVPVDRLTTLNKLFDLMFPSYMLKLIIGVIIVWALLFILYKKPWMELLSLTPLILISILPYVWFIILGNHNQHHGYFTYRIQAITVFSIFTFMILSLNVTKIKAKVKKISK